MSLCPFPIDYSPWEPVRGLYQQRMQTGHSPWDHYGVGILPAEMQLLSQLPLMLSHAGSKRDAFLAKPVVGKDGFQVSLDVHQFQPNEINVKTVDDFVVIEAKHDERPDEHGDIARHFVRKYKLPSGYDPNHVITTLSSDGVLTIKAPPPPKSNEANERVVHVHQTGVAHLNIKANKPEENGQK